MIDALHTLQITYIYVIAEIGDWNRLLLISPSCCCKFLLPLLQLQDYGKNPSGETEVQFRLTRVTLEPMLRSMAYISQQLSTPANKVAVINLKVWKLILSITPALTKC